MQNRASKIVLNPTIEQKLLALLEDENQALRKLKENLKLQYDVLISQNLNDFLKVLEEQRILVWETRQMEELRENELKELLPEIDQISLGEIIGKSSAEIRPKLLQLKKTFDDLVGDVKELKSINQQLISSSLEMVRKQIRFLQAFQQRSYTASGKEESRQLSSLNRQV